MQIRYTIASISSMHHRYKIFDNESTVPYIFFNIVLNDSLYEPLLMNNWNEFIQQSPAIKDRNTNTNIHDNHGNDINTNEGKFLNGANHQSFLFLKHLVHQEGKIIN